MKKMIVLLACFALVVVVQLMAGCSDPLDTLNGGSVSPPANTHDTVVIVDTTIIIDSVIIIDTVTHVDTVRIEEPDDCNPHRFCSEIEADHHEIVWLLQNREGRYHLEFAASAERDKPLQTVTVDMGKNQFTWTPAKQSVYVTDQYLKNETTIRITLSEPCAYGHSVDICLEMTRLK